MQFLSNLSIKKKIQYLLSIFVIIVLIVAGLLMLIRDINNIKSNIIKQTKLQSTLLKEYIVTPLIFDDKEGAQNILRKIDIIDYLKGVVVFDKEDSLYTFYLKEGYDYNVPQKKHKIGSIITGNNIHVANNIDFYGEKIGELHLLGSTNLMEKEINHVIRLYLIVIFLLMFVIWLLSAWLQKFISNPIIKLKEQTISIAKKKNYDLRLDENSHDEIGDLSREFNNLLDQITTEKEKRDQIQQEIRRQYEIFLAIMKSFPEYIYISDMNTYEILFTNDILKRILKTNPVGKLCYKVLYGFDKPCSFCNNDQLLNLNHSISWESHNELLNRDFMITDKAITWPDGRIVRFEVAVDITKRKKVEKELQELNNDLETKIAKRTTMLKEYNTKLMELNKVFAGREFRIKELKDKIEKLELELRKIKKV